MMTGAVIGAYGLAAVLHLAYLYRQKAAIYTAATLVLFVAAAAQATEMAIAFQVRGHLPFATIHGALSFFVWLMVGVYLVIQLRYRLPVIGAFMTPLALALALAGTAVPEGAAAELPPVFHSPLFPLHVGLAILGDAFFAMAFVISVMYLIQLREVKAKKLGFFSRRLPPLEELDEMNYRCLTLGFPLMTLGIALGALWAKNAWGSYLKGDPKEIWSLITWAIYVALLHLRLNRGWRGRKAAIMSIGGFLLLLFAFLGVNWLFSGYHNF